MVQVASYADKVKEIYVPGPRLSFGIIKFKDPGFLWDFVDHWRAEGWPTRNSKALWMSVEKTRAERERGKLIGKANR
eukprot:4242979-Alexandrium_andersonii.AAC.1